MKKYVFIVFTALFLAACNHTGQQSDPQKIREQIDNYRNEIDGLNKKIAALEKKLAEIADPAGGTMALKVKVQEAAVGKFTEYFEATGELEAKYEAYISPQVSGQIMEIYVSEGQSVREGELLVKLDTRIVEKNITEVKTQLDYAKTMFDKQKELWDKHIGSERQYLDAKNKYESLKNKLETLQAQYDMSMIYAPINGYVDKVMLKKGEMATPGMQIMYLVNLDKLWVSAMISESYLPVIRLGEMVEISFPTYPGLVMHRPISYIGNVVNKQNRTFKIKIEINNENGKLKPNLLASIRINNYNSTDHIVLPSWSIREDLKGPYVYIAEKSGEVWKAKKRYIQTGKSYRNQTEVLSGLTPGDKVITEGFNNVSNGTLLSIAGS